MFWRSTQLIMFWHIFKHLMSCLLMVLVVFFVSYLEKYSTKTQKRRSQGGAWAIDLYIRKFETTSSQAPLVPPHIRTLPLVYKTFDLYLSKRCGTPFQASRETKTCLERTRETKFEKSFQDLRRRENWFSKVFQKISIPHLPSILTSSLSSIMDIYSSTLHSNISLQTHMGCEIVNGVCLFTLMISNQKMYLIKLTNFSARVSKGQR